MRTGRAFMLSAMLLVQAFCVFADGTVSPPNPLGEAVWRSHLLPQLIPLGIFALAGLLFFAMWLVGRIRHKHEHLKQEVEPTW